MSEQECHMNLQFCTWSHMLAAILKRYPLDCMIKLLLLTTRSIFNNVGNFDAGRWPPHVLGTPARRSKPGQR